MFRSETSERRLEYRLENGTYSYWPESGRCERTEAAQLFGRAQAAQAQREIDASELVSR